MSWLVSLFLNWLWGKLLSLIAELSAERAAQEQIQKDAEKSVEPLKKADPEDAEAIDKGADDALGNF